jgi:hypothetical protein
MIDPADTATKSLPQATRMRFSSNGRMYSVVLTEDLLGDWTVIQSWAGDKSRRGGGKITSVASFDAGLALLTALAKRREQYGYQPVILAD